MSIRLGTCSPAHLPTSTETLALVSSIATRAASLKIDLLLLPEAFLGGYPRGTNFGCTVGARAEGGREEFARYFEGAADLGDVVGDGGAGGGDRWVKRELPLDAGRKREKQDDPYRGDGSREELEKIAKSTGVFIVVGVVERAGGSLYCSVVYVDPNEGMIGKRRKVMPVSLSARTCISESVFVMILTVGQTGTERLMWAQADPSTLRAVSTTIRGTRINLAAAICWESYMPLLRQTLYSQNINLYLAPTADGRDAWLSLVRTIGIEGRCYVVSSNMAVRDMTKSQSNDHREDMERSVGGRSRFRPRANSTITEDGHEIALPKSSSPTSRSPVQKHRKRRKSVLDEDGNEIVLCCDDDGEDIPIHSKSNGLTTQDSIPEDKESAVFDNFSMSGGKEKTTWLSRGGSCIVSPFGDVLAGPQWEDGEGIVFADVDFKECIKGRLDLDTAGSYSRNDAFNFSVKGLELDPLPYF